MRSLRTVGLDLVRYQGDPAGRPEQGQFAAPASLGGCAERFPFPPLPAGETFLPPEPPNGRDLIEDLIRERQLSVLLEIGSFLGGSTLRWLRASPDLVVVAVDPWQDGWRATTSPVAGYPDQRDGLNASNGLFEMFLRNVLPFAERVVPVRAASPMVLDELARLGLRPDLVFIDAAKLTGDLVTASELWPEAILTRRRLELRRRRLNEPDARRRAAVCAAARAGGRAQVGDVGHHRRARDGDYASPVTTGIYIVAEAGMNHDGSIGIAGGSWTWRPSAVPMPSSSSSTTPPPRRPPMRRHRPTSAPSRATATSSARRSRDEQWRSLRARCEERGDRVRVLAVLASRRSTGWRRSASTATSSAPAR